MKIKDATKSANIKIDTDVYYLRTSSQRALKSRTPRTILLLPDFVNYTRHLSSGNYKACIKEFLKNMNLGKAIFLNFKNIFALAPLSGIFWSALTEMALVDLSSAGRNEPIIINSFIVDLAFSSGKAGIIKNIIKLCKNGRRKIGLWTRNLNKLLANADLKELGIDFLVAPLNKFGIGTRVSESFLKEELARSKVKLIRDYVSHFSSFSNEIEMEKDNIIFL